MTMYKLRINQRVLGLPGHITAGTVGTPRRMVLVAVADLLWRMDAPLAYHQEVVDRLRPISAPRDRLDACAYCAGPANPPSAYGPVAVHHAWCPEYLPDDADPNWVHALHMSLSYGVVLVDEPVVGYHRCVVLWPAAAQKELQ